MKTKYTTLFLLLISISFFAQEKFDLSDLQALKNRNMVFYNYGSYSITTQNFSSPFSDKKLKPILRQYKIRWKKNKPVKDSLLKVKHYKFLDVQNVDSYKNYYAVYAIDHNGTTSIISFSKIGKLSSQFTSYFINSFVKNSIPKNIYAKARIDSIKYLNRYIKLGPGCHWMGVRNVQCPYNGQMDWTIHPTIQEAKDFNLVREKMTMSQKKLKLISKDTINISFEGKKTTAKKLTFDVKGITSFVLNLQSGAKNLIVYYIVEKIEGKYVSCILSHWDNDRIQPDGLPALLGEVMKLED